MLAAHSLGELGGIFFYFKGINFNSCTEFTSVSIFCGDNPNKFWSLTDMLRLKIF
jgi:hypothetical protein